MSSSYLPLVIHLESASANNAIGHTRKYEERHNCAENPEKKDVTNVIKETTSTHVETRSEYDRWQAHIEENTTIKRYIVVTVFRYVMQHHRYYQTCYQSQACFMSHDGLLVLHEPTSNHI